MAGPASLREVQLLCGSAQYNHGTFNDAQVLLCHTPVSQLTATYADNYGGNTPQTVFAVPTLNIGWTNNEWEGLVFDTPFAYDGLQNLIVEFRWDGDDGNSVYNWGWYPEGGNRVLDGSAPSATTGALRPYLNLLRLHFSGAFSLLASIDGGDIRLDWAPCDGTAAFWVYGAPGTAFFAPGVVAPYEHRLDVLSGTATTWATSTGAGDPGVNWTFMVMAVDGADAELARSNRAGEDDFDL
ncbi:MAG: hypothetical protein MUE60_04475 [Candidatus Eisenbacteria bacterium]|nr:hypothetical protein [Candidatus Eisenbacteria bacterium]